MPPLRIGKRTVFAIADGMGKDLQGGGVLPVPVQGLRGAVFGRDLVAAGNAIRAMPALSARGLVGLGREILLPALDGADLAESGCEGTPMFGLPREFREFFAPAAAVRAFVEGVEDGSRIH